MTTDFSDEKPIGTWFSPNGVAQAIKKMTQYDPDERLNVQVALNNALIISEIMTSFDGPWKPLLLFVPVRLGINEINPMYFDSLKVRNTKIKASFTYFNNLLTKMSLKD